MIIPQDEMEGPCMTPVKLQRNGFVCLVVSVVVLVSAILLGPLPEAQAAELTYAVENVALPSGKNPAFMSCDESTTSTCISGLALDGVQLTRATSTKDADVVIRGWVLEAPCRFVETIASSCEFPYFGVFRQNALSGKQLGVASISIRRRTGSAPTDRIGSAVVQGNIVSFLPAADGLRDISTLTVEPVDVQVGSSCVGFTDRIEQCVMSESATRVADNSIVVLMSPGIRSSVTPPDVTEPDCAARLYACVVTVLEKSSLGSWIDTTAAAFGEATSEKVTGASRLTIAGPHYKYAGGKSSSEVNAARLRMFMTADHLKTRFGLTPADGNMRTLPVTKITGTTRGTDASIVTTYKPSPEGLIIDSTNITFSQPTISVSRVLTVRRGQRVSIEKIAGAAGLAAARRFGDISVQANKSKNFGRIGSSIVFRNAGEVVLTIKYKSTVRTTSTRKLTVQVD